MIHKKISKEVKQLQIALGMGGVTTSHFACEFILETQKKIAKMGGKYSLMDASKLFCRIEKKYNKIQAEMELQTKLKSKKDGRRNKDNGTKTGK
jgi:hypothetical protein